MATQAQSRRPGLPVAPLIIGALLLVALYMIFWVAPVEQRMGDVYRVFYMHVPHAISAQLLFFSASLVSAVYLMTRRKKGMRLIAERADRLAHAIAEVSVLAGVIVLTTGPIWAKPAWGEYWNWEPRLTLTLLLFFLFVGYLVLRSGGGEKTKPIAAGIALVGAPASFLVHKAVELWGGNHPQVITNDGGGLATEGMPETFAVSMAAILLLMSFFVYMRYQHHGLRGQIDDLFLDLSDLDDDRGTAQ